MAQGQSEGTAEIHIRAATQEHVTAIAAIDAQIRGESRLFFWEQRLAPCLSAPKAAAESTPLCRVALVDGQVAGFILGQVRSEEFDLPRCGWILTIGVEPGLRGREVGRRLVSQLTDDLVQRGVSTIMTMVAWDSSELLSFFGSLGFDCGPFFPLEKQVGSAKPISEPSPPAT